MKKITTMNNGILEVVDNFDEKNMVFFVRKHDTENEIYTTNFQNGEKVYVNETAIKPDDLVEEIKKAGGFSKYTKLGGEETMLVTVSNKVITENCLRSERLIKNFELKEFDKNDETSIVNTFGKLFTNQEKILKYISSIELPEVATEKNINELKELKTNLLKVSNVSKDAANKYLDLKSKPLQEATKIVKSINVMLVPIDKQLKELTDKYTEETSYAQRKALWNNYFNEIKKPFETELFRIFVDLSIENFVPKNYYTSGEYFNKDLTSLTKNAETNMSNLLHAVNSELASINEKPIALKYYLEKVKDNVYLAEKVLAEALRLQQEHDKFEEENIKPKEVVQEEELTPEPPKEEVIIKEVIKTPEVSQAVDKKLIITFSHENNGIKLMEALVGKMRDKLGAEVIDIEVVDVNNGK